MIFKVKNLGYIEEAEVDLSKDLIVFTGHNNTGKTYLAYAIYYVLKNGDEILDANVGKEEHVVSPPLFKNILKELEVNRSISVNILDSLNHFFDENIFVDIINDAFKSDFFNVPGELFSTQGTFSNVEFSVEQFSKAVVKKLLLKSISVENDDSFVMLDESPENDCTLSVTQSYNNHFEVKIKIEYTNKKLDFQVIEKRFSDSLYTYFRNMIFDQIWYRNNHISTAERSAINIFSKELALSRIRTLRVPKSAKKNKDYSRLLNRYPLPIQDNLEIAEDLAHLSRNKSDFAYLAEELEQDFLKGTISTNQYGQIEYRPDNTDKVNLEIHLTASMVKSLSNIVFYLRHLAQKGDCIIIDEPELNLHPDNQRKIARFIGRLVNEGFQVVISTHSDYIIKELNNMIMLSKAKGERDDLIKSLGFRGDELLKPEQVEAQLFTLNSRKPEKIPITDEGFEVSTINEVIEKQDNDLEKIYYELFQKVM